jgi:methyl-accepting chemotaxis protein
MSVIALGGVSFMALKYKEASMEYSEFILRENGVNAEMPQIRAHLISTINDSYRAIAMTPEAVAKAGIPQHYDEMKSAIQRQIGKVRDLLPRARNDFDNLQQRVGVINALTDKAMALALKGDDAAAQQVMNEADAPSNKLFADMQDWSGNLQKGVIVKSSALAEQASRTALGVLAGLLASVLAALAGTMIIASRGITGPLGALVERMAGLAKGDTDTEISGLSRKDEVGHMASALEVFRDNAIERIRLEQSTSQERLASERERAAREAQKTREAGDVRFAVEALSDGLARLSAGDMRVSLETPFVGELDVVRTNFNQSLMKLQETLRSVGSNALAMDDGARQMRKAADDLSKRTEPPRLCRRPFGLSYAAMAGTSSMA